MCLYMKNDTSNEDCMGHGVCDGFYTGKCTCNQGWRGADCSKPVNQLSDGYSQTYQFNGSSSFYFQYDSGVQPDDEWELVLSNMNRFDVHINAGLEKDPNEFENQIEVKAQTFTKISSRAFPSLKTSFVAHVRITGIEFAENRYLESIFLVNFNKVP